MKTKKFFTSALAAAMTVSSIAALNSNAVGCYPATTDSELYKSYIDRFDSTLTPAPELSEYMDDILDDYEVKNVWVKTAFHMSKFSEYKIEYVEKDSFTFNLDIPAAEAENVVALLESELGHSDKLDSIRVEIAPNLVSFGTKFSTDDHELNLMLTEKAYSVLKEKYPIIDYHSGFERRCFADVRLQSAFTSIDGKSHMDMTEQEFKDFYDSIDHDYISENFRAVCKPDEHYIIEFPEDFTEEEKLGCLSYFVNNHNTEIHQYYPSSGILPISAEIDLESGESEYCGGDANCDSIQSMADAASIFQAIGNPDKYALSRQGEFNADFAGDGLTPDDAIAIQKKLAGIID